MVRVLGTQVRLVLTGHVSTHCTVTSSESGSGDVRLVVGGGTGAAGGMAAGNMVMMSDEVVGAAGATGGTAGGWGGWRIKLVDSTGGRAGLGFTVVGIEVVVIVFGATGASP